MEKFLSEVAFNYETKDNMRAESHKISEDARKKLRVQRLKQTVLPGELNTKVFSDPDSLDWEKE